VYIDIRNAHCKYMYRAYLLIIGGPLYFCSRFSLSHFLFLAGVVRFVLFLTVVAQVERYWRTAQ